MITQSHSRDECRIRTWRQFDREVRAGGDKLLRRLDEFPNAILVAGCQRSGTTILSRVLMRSEGMINYWPSGDEELGAALILSGRLAHEPRRRRYCFQTTYINNRFEEYFEHDQYKLIWVLRNPHSVVYSMLHNWRQAALNRLFHSCGSTLLDTARRRRYERFGVLAIDRTRRACLSYNAKASQIFEIKKRLRPDQLLILDYDDLVARTQDLLAAVYNFVGLEYRVHYAARIHGNSVNKANRMSNREATLVESVCMPVYLQTRTVISDIQTYSRQPKEPLSLGLARCVQP